MVALPVTPLKGLVTFVATGGTSVVVVPPAPNGGFITNPLAPSDQAVTNGEPLYVDPVGTCGALAANGTIFRLEPGQSWTLIPGQTTPTYVNATTSGHKFSAVYY